MTPAKAEREPDASDFPIGAKAPTGPMVQIVKRLAYGAKFRVKSQKQEGGGFARERQRRSRMKPRGWVPRMPEKAGLNVVKRGLNLRLMDGVRVHGGESLATQYDQQDSLRHGVQ